MGCLHRPAAGWWRHHTGGVCGRAVDSGLCWRQAGDRSKKLHFHPLTTSRLGKAFELTIPATCERDRGIGCACNVHVDVLVCICPTFFTKPSRNSNWALRLAGSSALSRVPFTYYWNDDPPLPSRRCQIHPMQFIFNVVLPCDSLICVHTVQFWLFTVSASVSVN